MKTMLKVSHVNLFYVNIENMYVISLNSGYKQKKTIYSTHSHLSALSDCVSESLPTTVPSVGKQVENHFPASFVTSSGAGIYYSGSA